MTVAGMDIVRLACRCDASTPAWAPPGPRLPERAGRLVGRRLRLWHDWGRPRPAVRHTGADARHSRRARLDLRPVPLGRPAPGHPPRRHRLPLKSDQPGALLSIPAPPPPQTLTPPTDPLNTQHASRFTPEPHVSRLTPHVSRLTPHVSRLTFHASRFTPRASPPHLSRMHRPTKLVVACHLRKRSILRPFRCLAPSPATQPIRL